MNETQSDKIHPSIESLELKISYFLRYGVFTAAGFLALGWFGRLLTTEGSLDHFQIYEPESLKILIQKALSAHDYAMLSATLGLTILISLPIIRVFLTAYLFLKSKDWYLAAMAIFVFAVLSVSFLLGIDL